MTDWITDCGRAATQDERDRCDACDCWKSQRDLRAPIYERMRVQEEVGESAECFTPAALQAIADGPLMDPGNIYLPAGRLSIDDWRAREARILRGEAP